MISIIQLWIFLIQLLIEVLNEWGHQLEEETLRNFKNGGQNVDWA